MRPQFAAAPPTEPCEFHPEHLRPIDFDLTCARSAQAGRFVPTYRPCALCEAQEKAARQRRYWSRRGVPERVLEATFANFVADTEPQQKALATAKAWARRQGNFLLLCGKLRLPSSLHEFSLIGSPEWNCNTARSGQ